MQRRLNASTSSKLPLSSTPRQNIFSRRRNNNNNANRSFSSSIKTFLFNPINLLLFLAISIFGLSLYFFPAEVYKVEKDVEVVGHNLAVHAIEAEHEVENWVRTHQYSSSSSSLSAAAGNVPNKETSKDATARMMAQSSKWMDGEKALRKQLQVLMDQQQQDNKNLGVPILTRYLGDDFPAFVTKDMNEQEWKQKVDEKYKQMRKEEEEWQIQMQQLMDIYQQEKINK